MPKRLYGEVPNKDFASNDTPFDGIKVGIVTRVDEHHLKADVRVISGSDERFELDLTQAMAGPRSFLGGIPEVNAVVLVGYRRRSKRNWDPVILGYLPVGSLLGLKFDPLSPTAPNEVDAEDVNDVKKLLGSTVRHKRIKGRQGDIFGMSSSGAELHLSKDVVLTNRAGDAIELRDVDRTLVTQALHHAHSDAAVYKFSGPVRRGAMNLPLWVYRKDEAGNITRVLKDESERYYGRDELYAAGVEGTYTNTEGLVQDRLNEDNEFPPTTYSNNRQVFYASEASAVDFEDVDNGGTLRAFTEHRMEVRHDSDLRTEVLEEIDGFGMDRPRTYIEQVFGTTVGNDAFTTQGQRQYARVLKPKLFEDFDQIAAPSGFAMEDCIRPPSTSVDEALTMAGGYLFRLKPPRSNSQNDFALAVSKQGKVFLNIPGSSVENYLAKNISAEINTAGAVKMHLGASTPDRTSLHMTLDGGIFLDVGSNANGEAITANYRCAIKQTFHGGNGVDDVAHSLDVQGNAEKSVSGNDTQSVKGLYQKNVDGGFNIQANAVKLHGLNGFSGNFGSYSTMISGKTQNHYSESVQETIATQGKITTVLAGAVQQTLNAGAYSTTVAAGATSFTNGSGAFSISVGTGAISIATGSGAISISTAAGAISMSSSAAVAITAGLAMNLTASTAINLTAPTVALGLPTAPLGVCRGLTNMPPGAPSLDYITGSALMGSAVIRSI